MKRQTIVRHKHGRNADKERQLILAITGPLKGLVYIIFLPIIGIFAIFMLGIRKLAVALQVLRELLAAPRDNDNPRQAS